MKKKLKKSLLTIAVAITLSFALMFSALAVSFEHLANDLNDLGLFQGTDIGYELDRAPSRAEALAMMIRFLGLAEAAYEGDYEHPFTDVPNWAEDYVAYAYEYELTRGMSETLFGPAVVCTARMYVTFLLRALGYSDETGGDFAYLESIEFAKDVGIIDELLATAPFLRDEMVAVSFIALGVAPKDSDFDTLLEKLIDDGAVDEAAAAAILERFAVYNEFVLLSAEFDEETSIAMVATIEIDMGILGSVTMDMEMNMVMDGTDILAEISTVMEMAGEEITARMYISDGYIYIDDGTDKIKMDAGLADLDELFSMAEMGALALNPIYFITDITKITEDDLTVYTVKFADSFMDVIFGLAVGMMGDAAIDLGELEGMAITIPEMRYYADDDGALVKMAIVMGMTVEGVTMTMSMEIEITATGDDVTVTLPDDLDDFVLVDPDALTGEEDEE